MTEILQTELESAVETAGKDINIRLVRLLCEKGLKISFAESCTGGMLAQRLTAVDGASACFDGSYVTYSNEQKMRLLDVKAETLDSFGAVSYETASEMSSGVKKEFAADIGVGVTGIAGPGGGTPEKPVGLVYISVCTDKVHWVCKLKLDGDRSSVREGAYKFAYALVLHSLGLQKY